MPTGPSETDADDGGRPERASRPAPTAGSASASGPLGAARAGAPRAAAGSERRAGRADGTGHGTGDPARSAPSGTRGGRARPDEGTRRSADPARDSRRGPARPDGGRGRSAVPTGTGGDGGRPRGPASRGGGTGPAGGVRDSARSGAPPSRRGRQRPDAGTAGPGAASSDLDHPAGSPAPDRPAGVRSPAGPRRGVAPGPGRSAGRGDARRAELEQRRYDPRREERRRAARIALPDDVQAQMLDPDVRRELRSLSKETADLVARHLVVAGRTIDEDPLVALAHASAARALAGRVGAVREAAGLTAYAAGQWAQALAELRAARRITGAPAHLPVLADCERALGRPDRALAYGDDPGVTDLDQEQRVELAIVLSGARRDMAQADAAVVLLDGPARRTRRGRPWAARLWYALADALLDAGRPKDARSWFAAAAEVDRDGQTDATERLLALDGIWLHELDPAGEDVAAQGVPGGAGGGATGAGGPADDPKTAGEPTGGVWPR